MIQSAPREEPNCLKEPQKPKKELGRYGFTQPWRVRFWPFLLVLIVVLIYLTSLIALGLINESPPIPETLGTTQVLVISSGRTSKASTIATAVLALGAFIVGYHQWRAARRETSMDKFYDRLNVANSRLEDVGIDPFILYVYAEMDNLEYVIEKYRLGYMSPDQALRGLKAFQSRLRGVKGEDFKKLALVSLDNSAYSPNTCKVVNLVIGATPIKPD